MHKKKFNKLSKKYKNHNWKQEIQGKFVTLRCEIGKDTNNQCNQKATVFIYNEKEICICEDCFQKIKKREKINENCKSISTKNKCISK